LRSSPPPPRHRPKSPRPPSTPPSAPQRTEPPRAGRIQKLLAAAGFGSRREIESWIAAGRITIEGRIVQLGERAAPGTAIEIDGKPVELAQAPVEPRVIAYHKPVGEVVSRDDPGGRRTVFERLPPLRGTRWVAVGRLDLNSAGLLLFTDSGELANRLMHPRHGIEREYAARVSGELSRETQRQLLDGIQLDDGIARFDRIQSGDKASGVNRWYRVMLREGRNREVRRMFEAVGLQVSRLLRVRMGSVSLPRDLRPGRWVELSPIEVQALENVAR
jgi:23S rRNA pseudouridine2605 synthase